MRTYGLLNVCALIASGVALAIACILIPEKAWTNTTIATVAVFAMAVAFVFFSPSLFRRKTGRSDAVAFAAIAPLGAITICFVGISAGAVILALAGLDRPAMALVVLAVGALLLALLLLRAAMNVVSHVAEVHSMPGRHLKWQSDIQRFRTMSPNKKTTRLLDALTENMRYLASDIPGGTPYDAKIESAVDAFGDKLGMSEDSVIESHVKEIEALLGQREIFLRSARNKA